MSLLRCEYVNGAVWLPALGLWLDAREPRPAGERVFVSHAHSDHVGEHHEVILSARTAHLMQVRLPGERVEHRLGWHQPAVFEHDGREWRISLVPAGHICGSSMALIEAGGERLLYTGDFKMRPGMSAEPCEPVPADILVMETTYGRPEYVFPPTDAVVAGVVRFCRQALDNDETPVLLGYSLGKSQEILCGLRDAGLPIALHPQVARFAKVYESFGEQFPPYVLAQGPVARGHVIVCPPGATLAGVTGVGPVRKAVLTGWAMDPGCRFRYRADAAFPLSDHADFPGLLEMVERVRPKQVLTLHGYAAEFAAALRLRGWSARALSEPEQMTLPLLLEEASVNRVAARSGETVEDPCGGDGAFTRFAATCAAIGHESSKRAKTEILADFLRGQRARPLAVVTRWFSGRAETAGAGAVMQVGWAAIREAVCRVAGIEPGDFHGVYLRHSDLGETVHELFENQGRTSRCLSIEQVADGLEAMASARGPTRKVPLLAGLLAGCDANEGRYLAKVLTGDLRIGLKEGLVEDAVARAFEVAPEQVRRAHLLTGDLSETAILAQAGRIETAALRPFRPVRVMLASPEPTAQAVWERVLQWRAHPDPAQDREIEIPAAEPADDAAAEAWIEDKYDGIRCQLHRVGERVELYSRDLKEVTAAFRDVADAARVLPADVVLDGELVAMRDGAALPFAVLQRRLGRREADLFLREEIPVAFVAFDVLWMNGETLCDRPLRERRELLESIAPLPEGFHLARVERVSDAAGVEAQFDASRIRGNEGLMIKSPASRYVPGRRGLAWLKLKRAGATLDCVVVGAEYGHGRRKDVLSDYTFAVRDERTGELKTIGKAYSGLTDAEIERLTRHLRAQTIARRGRYHLVEPDIVLEIAFDRLQPSPRHGSGLAMRFPRIVRLRDDKTVSEVDTVGTAWRIAGKWLPAHGETTPATEKAGPSDRRQGGGGGEPR